MPNKRDLKLDEYHIGKYAYRELHNFCLQYPGKKKRLAELRYPYHSPTSYDMSHGSDINNQTAQNAIRAAALSSDCEMIEQAAIQAGGEDYQHLLLAVTQDAPWHYLKTQNGLETYEKGFRKEIHQFFFYLAKKKEMV